MITLVSILMGGVEWGRRAGVDGKFLLKYREVTATEVMRSFIWEPLRIPCRKHGFQLALKGKINILVDCRSLCMTKLTVGQMYRSINTCWFAATNFYVSIMCQTPFKLILIKIPNSSGLRMAHLSGYILIATRLQQHTISWYLVSTDQYLQLQKNMTDLHSCLSV